MEIIQNETCIVFKERSSETAYISFKNDESGCFATAGYQGKKQEVNMGSGCFGKVIHHLKYNNLYTSLYTVNSAADFFKLTPSFFRLKLKL
jgi:Astacin (Peptidase family M12A)